MKESDLHEYQKTGIQHAILNPFAGLFMQMGLGKTVTTLTAINYLMYQDLEVDKVLVIAPRRVVESVWDAEAANWEHLKYLRFSKIHGTEKQRKAALLVKADIYLISRDNIAWLCGLYGGLKLPFDTVVIDELSSFKSPKAQRFKALKKIRPSLKRVIGLTGTPAPNGLIDLWAQMYLLDMGERLGKTITSYREKYFKAGLTVNNVVYKYKALPGSEKQIYGLIGDICLSMSSKDYLDMPDAIINDIRINFPEKLQKQYDDFEKEKVLELFDNEEDITAMNAAGLRIKLLQFANGAVYDENRNYREVHNLKIEALDEILDTANGAPVLVAWTFRHDMHRIKEHLKKYKPRELKSDKDVQEWNRGEIPLMMMHPASGGHGLNLQAGGNIIVWFGQTDSSELYNQFNARLDRQGQKQTVVINRLLAVNTFDTKVVDNVTGKINTEAALMDAIKAIVKKHIKK